MGRTTPLSADERARIRDGRQRGQTLAQLADSLQRSPEVVRKWARYFRDQGAKREPPKLGRPRRGPLSTFPSAMVAEAAALKRAHPRWGAARVRVALAQQIEWQGQSLPSRSRLAAAFRTLCPEAVGRPVRRSAPTQAPPAAQAVHEVWQVDHQEKQVLGDGSYATVCNVRDPVGAAMIASQAFSTKTEKRWRKLTTAEVQTVLRTAFDEWHTLPDCVLTDNELGLAGSPHELFPSRLTLWLRGLGIVHQRIRPHQPTEQAHVERQHRTLDNFTADATRRIDLSTFQAALDVERQVYNTAFPCRASDCHGRPPLTAHPELCHPRRPYPPNGEVIIFDLQRVFDYLATFTFERHISSQGHLHLNHTAYYVGAALVNKNVWIRCDPVTSEWLVYDRTQASDPAGERLLKRLPIKNLSAQTLAGRELQPIELAQPVQLSFPCFA